MESNCELEIGVDPQKIKLGKDVNLALKLKNTRSQDLWVNKRLLLNSVHSPAPMRELWVEIVGPGGKEVPFSSRVRAGDARAEDYGVLRAGQSLSKEVNLSNYFEFEEPGSYKVTAHYQDGTEQVPKGPGGTPHLEGKVSSAPAEFELVGAP